MSRHTTKRESNHLFGNTIRTIYIVMLLMNNYTSWDRYASYEYYPLYKLFRDPKRHPLSDTTVYTVFVDVEDLEEKVTGEIFIFPNPASEYIEINYQNVESGLRPVSIGIVEDIRIYNILGILVLTSQINHKIANTRINIESLQTGVYFVFVGNTKLMFVKQ